MDLTTELLDNAAFREAKRGGYNTQDVDDFIEQVKAEYSRHGALLREAQQRLETVEIRLADAERRAAEGGQRSTGTSEMEESLKRTLVLAQRTADAAIKEAEEQAARTLAAAQDEASRMLAEAQETSARARAEAEAEARRAQEDARARVLRELRDLEAARDQLHSDVDTLERHLEEQRDRVRVTTRELQRLLDDPASLREMAVPAVSDVVVAPSSELDDALAPTAYEEGPSGWSPTPAEAEPGAYATPAAEAGGLPTRGIDLNAVAGSDDDAYLAELRKAMTDEAPLGPREEGDVTVSLDSAADQARSRFGRRR